MKIISTFSGGLDSTVLLHYLISKGHEVTALSFDYRQKHLVELDYAKETTKILKIEHVILPLPLLSMIGSKSSVLGGEGSPIVPCRNALMISSAWALAEALGADGVAVGAHAGDSLDFPDCRPVFFDALAKALQLGSGKDISLWRPFVHKSKSDIVRIGIGLGVDFSKTYTCYKGGEIPCGVCPSCVGRKDALMSNNIYN